jgi:hypothetical protein
MARHLPSWPWWLVAASVGVPLGMGWVADQAWWREFTLSGAYQGLGWAALVGLAALVLSRWLV